MPHYERDMVHRTEHVTPPLPDWQVEGAIVGVFTGNYLYPVKVARIEKLTPKRMTLSDGKTYDRETGEKPGRGNHHQRAVPLTDEAWLAKWDTVQMTRAVREIGDIGRNARPGPNGPQVRAEIAAILADCQARIDDPSIWWQED